MSKGFRIGLFGLVAMVLGGCLPIELSVSPKGEILVPRSEGYVVLDPAAQAVRLMYDPGEGKAMMAQWRPDGASALALTETSGGGMGANYALSILSPDGSVRKLMDVSNALYARWSPDGAHIAVTRQSGSTHDGIEQQMPELLLVDPANGASRVVANNTSKLLRWFPDGSGVLVFQATTKDEEKDIYTGQLVKVTPEGMEPLAAVMGKQDVFFDVSPDGAKVLFTAIDAGKVGETFTLPEEPAARLHELSLKLGSTAEVDGEYKYGFYSPQGDTIMLVGGEENDGMSQLFVMADGAAKIIAEDVATNTGGMGNSSDIYAGWYDKDRILYIRRHAVLGTTGYNYQIVLIPAVGGAVQNLQPMLETKLLELAPATKGNI
jgi:Tol biopolymer transport system component